MSVARSLTLALLLGLMTLWLGCQGEPERATPQPRAESAPRGPVVEELSWRAHEGAERYELRVWAAHRLLFETTAADTLLELTPVQRRSIASFDSVRLIVRAMRSGERIQGSKRSYRLGG